MPLTPAILSVLLFGVAVWGIYWLWWKFDQWGTTEAGLAVSYGVGFPTMILFSLSAALGASFFCQCGLAPMGMPLAAVGVGPMLLVAYASGAGRNKYLYLPVFVAAFLLVFLYWLFGPVVDWFLGGLGGFLASSIISMSIWYNTPS